MPINKPWHLKHKMPKNPIRKIAIALSFLFILVLPKQSLALLPSECGKLKFATEVSTVIVKGEITQVETGKESDVIYTYTSVKVDKYYKGSGAENIIIRQWGGCEGDMCSWAEDEPNFAVGQKGRFFLAKDSGYYVPVCGWGVISSLDYYKSMTGGYFIYIIGAVIILSIAALILLKKRKKLEENRDS